MTSRSAWVATLLLSVFPPGTVAQTLETRVLESGADAVRMSFPARDGVCGDGSGAIMMRVSTRTDDDWEPTCDAGPVRVSISLRGRDITDLRMHLGGQWRPKAGVVDLGAVDPEGAADFLLGLAETGTGPWVEATIAPAALARGATVFPRLAALARNGSRPRTVRERAIFWVPETGDAGDAMPVLTGLLRDDDPAIQERALFALARLDTAPARDLLRSVARDRGASMPIREKAIFWLGQGQENVQGLMALYHEDGLEGLRERVVFAVSQASDPEATRWLRELARRDGEPVELRERAIFWLSQRRDHGLADLYEEFDDQRLRERVIFALSQAHDESATGKLLQIAREEPDAELRRRALFWLGQSSDPRAVELLEALILK